MTILDSGFWILASGFWLLASGFWLLASGCFFYDRGWLCLYVFARTHFAVSFR
jgi:hypothetical protein